MIRRLFTRRAREDARVSAFLAAIRRSADCCEVCCS
jgi:hypothetical protein